MHDFIHSHALQKVLDRLSNVKKTGKGFKACCPAHEDRNPSLAVWQRDDGSIGLKCYAGCTFDEICSALNLDRSELRPERSDSERHSSGDWRHNPKTVESSGDLSPPPRNPAENRSGFPRHEARICPENVPEIAGQFTKQTGFSTLQAAIERLSHRLGETSCAPWIYHGPNGNELGAGGPCGAAANRVDRLAIGVNLPDVSKMIRPRSRLFQRHRLRQ